MGGGDRRHEHASGDQLREAGIDVRQLHGRQIELPRRALPCRGEDVMHTLRPLRDHQPIRHGAAHRDRARVDDALQAAMVGDGDAVGNTLQLVQIVRRDEDDAVGTAKLTNEVAEALCPDGVEPVRRLVEHQHLLVVQECLREPEPLEITLGELPHLLSTVLLETEQGDELRDPRCDRARGYTSEQRVPLQCMLEPPPWRDVHELREISNPVALDILPRSETADANLASGGAQVAEQQRDERALAGTVRAREAKDLTERNGNGEVFYRSCLAEESAVSLANRLQLDECGVVRQ